MKILLMGATGNAGTQAIKSLQAKGIRPVAAVRDIDKAKAKLGENVDYVYFDFFKPETYADALKGIDRIFFIAPPPSKDPEVIRNITRVAKEQGVQFALFQSGRTTGNIEGKPLFEIATDLKKGDLDWCMIQPCWYMQNFHTWMGTHLGEDKLVMNTGSAKVAFVDLQDLGGAIAEILSGEGHNGKVYTLTGGEAIDNFQVASTLSETSGRNIVYNAVSEEECVVALQEKGWNEYGSKYTAWLYNKVAGGSESEVTPDLQNLLGREPRTFRQFAQDEFGK